MRLLTKPLLLMLGAAFACLTTPRSAFSQAASDFTPEQRLERCNNNKARLDALIAQWYAAGFGEEHSIAAEREHIAWLESLLFALRSAPADTWSEERRLSIYQYLSSTYHLPYGPAAFAYVPGLRDQMLKAVLKAEATRAQRDAMKPEMKAHWTNLRALGCYDLGIRVDVNAPPSQRSEITNRPPSPFEGASASAGGAAVNQSQPIGPAVQGAGSEGAVEIAPLGDDSRIHNSGFSIQPAGGAIVWGLNAEEVMRLGSRACFRIARGDDESKACRCVSGTPARMELRPDDPRRIMLLVDLSPPQACSGPPSGPRATAAQAGAGGDGCDAMQAQLTEYGRRGAEAIQARNRGTGSDAEVESIRVVAYRLIDDMRARGCDLTPDK